MREPTYFCYRRCLIAEPDRKEFRDYQCSGRAEFVAFLADMNRTHAGVWQYSETN